MRFMDAFSPILRKQGKEKEVEWRGVHLARDDVALSSSKKSHVTSLYKNKGM